MWSASGFSIWFASYRKQLCERGVRDLRIIVMTYNTVWDYRSGIVPNTPPGLTVEIVSGGGRSGFVEDMDGEIIALRPGNTSDTTKSAGMQSLREAITKCSTPGVEHSDSATLVLLYAGISRREEIADLARTLHARGMDVALVTCGCNFADDLRMCSPLECERITVANFWGFTGCPSGTLPCHGGRDLLRDIVRAAIDIW